MTSHNYICSHFVTNITFVCFVLNLYIFKFPLFALFVEIVINSSINLLLRRKNPIPLLNHCVIRQKVMAASQFYC